MTTSLDLFLLPLVRQAGQAQTELPGLRAASAPRRSGRGRSGDLLILHLALEGTAPLSPKGLDKLLNFLTETYYNTGGSATTAMRAAAEALNEYLLDRNMRGSSRGMQAYGLFTIAVLRGDMLFLGQSAGTQAYLLQAEGFQHLSDPATGRGLGAGRVATLRFRQANLAAGDALLICPAPPAAWTAAALAEMQGLSFEHLHQRLLQRAGAQLEAVLVQARAGSGAVRLVWAEPQRSRAAPDAAASPERSQIPAPAALLVADDLLVAAETGPEVVPDPLPDPVLVAVPASPPAPAVVGRPARFEAAQAEPLTPDPRSAAASERQPAVLGPALRKLGQALWAALQQALQALRALVRRTLPDENLPALPTSVMAFIAVAVPIFVVAIAMMVYVNQGRDTMYAEFITQARAAYDQSLGLETPDQKREAWQQILLYVNQAEVYRVTTDTLAFRAQAHAVLDELDVVQRLDFRPALIRELPSGVLISRIVTTMDNDLYLLNANGGNVYRATFNGSGYEIDTTFACGPVPKPLIVQQLVDIVALPLGYPTRAAVMGMDQNGNLLQCIPGESPLAFQMGLPDTNWGKPRALALDSINNLYVLDPITNAVWIYDGFNREFRESPQLYFGSQVPPMTDVIDLAVISDDLFLLHADGHITHCIFNNSLEAPTRCTEPAYFEERRQGYTSGEYLAGTAFTEIQSTVRPETALYLLDQEGRAIFFFSRRLAMQSQFRSSNLLPEGEITAFYVGENRLAFVAIGHQVFFAQMP